MTNDFQIEQGVVTAYTGSATRVVLPAGIRAVGDACFQFREDIAEVVFPQGLLQIGPEAFSGCTSLMVAQLPASIQEIGPGAFADCAALHTVTLPDSLQEIADGAFLYCGALRELSLPQSLRRIGYAAFQGTGLTEVRLPPSVTEIGENAFWECNAITSAEVPNREAQIGPGAFGCCYLLTRGYIAPGYPNQTNAPDELLYTLLALGCLPRHTEETVSRATAYVRQNETLVMERVLKYNHVAAMTGLLQHNLVDKRHVDEYVKLANANGQTEITALLLRIKGGAGNWETEFSL